MIKRIMSVLLVVIMSLGISACKGTEPENAPETDWYQDDAGRSVAVPADVNRIVPTSALSQMILLTAAPEKMVALSSRLSEDAMKYLPSEIVKLPYIGSLTSGAESNIEDLALTEPQLIIDIGESKHAVCETLDKLTEQTLIPTVFLSVSLEDMPETYRKLGHILGEEHHCEELAQFYEKVYERTLQIMDRVGNDKVNCLYVSGEEGLNVIAAGSYHAELIDLLTNNLAVVDNPSAKGLGNEVSMEQISVWDPEFVVFSPGSIFEDVKDLAPWNQIKAIANDNYVEIPGSPFNWMGMPPSVQRCLGMIWLTAQLYPQHCNYDTEQEIREFFKLFYGYELSDGEYDTIIKNAVLR